MIRRKFAVSIFCLCALGAIVSPSETRAFDGDSTKRDLTFIDNMGNDWHGWDERGWREPYGQPSPLGAHSPPSEGVFVSFLTEIQSALDQSGLQPDGLTIIRMPIWTKTPPPQLNASAGELCVDSPWARLFRQDGRIGGHILWSERQFLRDRLGRGDWETPPTPFLWGEFSALTGSYVGWMTTRKDEAGAGHIPAEVHRLFQQSPQVTLVPFEQGIFKKMESISEAMSVPYAEQVIHMIRRCAEGGAPLRLQAPADLAAAFGPSAYSKFSD